MTNRLRVLRLVIVASYLAVGLGVALWLFGSYALIGLPAMVLILEPVFEWVTGARENRRMRNSILTTGRDALTSEQMDWSLSGNQGRITVIDDDPKWGKLVEGRERTFNQALTAVQVTNSTAEPDGTFKKVWLRVPSRGDRQGTRTCTFPKCGKDISWPPRTAKEAIAWTFRLCNDHYEPSKAS